MHAAVGAVGDQADMAHKGAAAEDLVLHGVVLFHGGAHDVHEVAILQFTFGAVDLLVRQILIFVLLDRNVDGQPIPIFEELGAVDHFGELDRFVAGKFFRDVFDEPAVGDIPIGFGVMVAGNDAKMAVTVANALQHVDEARPIVREGHGVRMFGENEAIALAKAIDRLWIVGLERHFAQKVKLIGLADVLAGQMHDSLAKIGLGGRQEFQVGIDFGFIEFVKRLVDELGDLLGIQAQSFASSYSLGR